MKRLLDDPNLQEELRNDLRRSRVAGESYDVTTKLALLHSWLPTPSEAPASDAMADPSRLQWPRLDLTPWTWKLAVLAVVGGASLFALGPADREPRSQRTLPAKPQVIASPTLTRPVAVNELAPQKSEPTVVEAPVPRAAVSQPPASSSRREISRLVRIRALLTSDPAAAYRLAQRCEQEFPDGVLSEERQALQVVALAKSGARENARRRAVRFFARYPESPMRELVESALNQ